MTARGIRNNNPGNIRKGDSWVGVTGDDGEFSIFDTPEHGIRAMAKVLIGYQTKHGDRTLRQIISRYAPPTENYTDAYIAAVAQACGIKPDEELTFTPSRMFDLVKAMIVHENGSNPYSDDVVHAGVDLAFTSPEPSRQPAPIEERDLSHVPPRVERPINPEQDSPVDPLTLIGIFGPIIANLIPQVGKLFGSGSDVSNRNIAAATTVMDTIVKATGAVNEQQAMAKIQADPVALKTATEAVLTEPSIMQLLEVGGGIEKARDYDLHVMASETPFYKTSAVFWMSMILTPMVFWYVGSSIVGGVVIPDSWPWMPQLFLKLFGTAWDPGAKVGLANLVVGMILGGIVGVYYGVSVTQQKQQATVASGGRGTGA